MRTRSRKIIAWFFLIVFTADTLLPTTALALTSGPAQPEFQQFQPAGMGDLVDLFTGDLRYNIPLMDVGGYPVNLAYQSGTGMEDEASWVGTGWNLNPGAINRDMRGFPDDFNGDNTTDGAGDQVTKIYSRKEFTKIGGRVTLKPSFLAWETGSGSLHVGVYRDNYYGMGAELGASLSFGLAKNKKTALTAGLNINSDVREGVSISPNFSLGREQDLRREQLSGIVSGSFAYNTRGGLQELSLGASFGTSVANRNSRVAIGTSAHKYFGQTYTPSFNQNTLTEGFTFSFDFGPSIFGAYLGVGGEGYYHTEKLAEKISYAPAYGYLNYLSGRKNQSALLDFNREKDGVYIPGTPSVAIPVATPDLFTATSQFGSRQFRPWFGGSYVVFDKVHTNITNKTNAGLTAGAGNLFKGGGRIDVTGGDAVTKKWVFNNAYLNKAEEDFTANPAEEAIYFKQSGELAAADADLHNKLKNEETQQVVVERLGAGFIAARTAFSFRNKSQSQITDLKKRAREKKTTTFTYLTAKQAAKYGLDKTINGESRVTAVRKPHHISEMMVTDDEGKRLVYGLPVYNLKKEEVSFSIDRPSDYETARRTGLVPYTANNENSTNNGKGRDNMFSKDILNGYASSFLLTGVLSPDYVDKTGDGITDDDAGTAIKFKYTKISSGYRWRAPFAAGMANYNEGFVNEYLDDRANYVYGEKEVWMLNAIESKTMIAFFETSPREDAQAVKDENGGMATGNQAVKLNKIKLYSKAAWLKDGANAVPIKTVHFEYDYSLYPGVPNNTGKCVDKYGNPPAGQGDCSNPAVNVNLKKGKLTLKKVYFTFGNNNRGQSNPYEFNYDLRDLNTSGNPWPQIAATDDERNDTYLERQSDRWGTYKKSWYNLQKNGSTSRVMYNSEFPYALQQNDNTTYNEKELAGRLASKWQLTQIKTPTGSVINAEYESDDYSYVQDRRAMQMFAVSGVEQCAPNGQCSSKEDGTGLSTARGLVVDLPKAAATVSEFREKYLMGADGIFLDKIYYKVYTDLTNENKFEYVQGYASIDPDIGKFRKESDYRYVVPLLPLNGSNPISAAAWQMTKLDLPQYAYDNYDNSSATGIGGNLSAAVMSLVQSILNFSELTTPFEKKAKNRRFADKINFSKSMIRLYSHPDLGKLGGGSRVRKLTLSDQWQTMNSAGKTAVYGQLFEYTKKDAAGRLISSGVASYEPQIGNEENPFHEPVNFTEKVHWGANRYRFVEKPFCESYFPAASIGYSKVSVISFGDDYVRSGGATLKRHTGQTEHEFYTAREFPTIVDNLPVDQIEYENSLIVKLFSSTYVKRMAASQGFKVVLNDMHGKPKAVRVYNKGGDEISADEYFYNVVNEQAEAKELNNKLDVLNPDGTIQNKSLGTDIDFVTDVRESTNESTGTSVGIYSGGMIIPLTFFPLYIPYAGVNFNYSISTDEFRSVSAVKVVHKYGIVKSVRTMKNGSSVTAENLLWDEETGDVLLTRTQNEFNDYTYAFNYPAYMAEEHDGMGAAYKNVSVVFPDFSSASNGIISTAYSSYLIPGDELVGLDNNVKGWVIRSLNNSLRLINADGDFIATSGRFMVLRSGKRNQTSAIAGSVVVMNDPRVTVSGVKRLELGADKRVLDAKSILYGEKWPVPVGFKKDELSPIEVPVTCENDFLKSFLKLYVMRLAQEDPAVLRPIRARLFAPSSAPENLFSLLTAFEQPPFSAIFTPPLATGTFQGYSYAQVSYYVDNPKYNMVNGERHYYFEVGDKVTFRTPTGLYKFTIATLDPLFNQSVNFQQIPIPSSGFFCYEGSGNCQIKMDYAQKIGPTIQVATVNPGKFIFACKEPDAPGNYINPYYTGLLGNWRVDQSYAFTVQREQKAGLAEQPGGTDIRNSGYYNSFTPFWIFKQGGGIKSNVPLDNPGPNDPWLWTTSTISFDRAGNELESKDAIKKGLPNGSVPVDALYRYNAALFGYEQTLATAIGANARNNEIAFDGFEDYYFSLKQTGDIICPLKRHLDWGFVYSTSNNTWCSPAGCISPGRAHSGKYSLNLTGTATISKGAGNAAPVNNFLGYDGVGRYQLLDNEFAKGFRPVANKKYLVSMWVHDGNAATNKINGLQVSINGQDKGIANIEVPVVEEWKRIELIFTAGPSFDLSLVKTGGTIYIDDLRILPYDGHLKSFVYNDQTMRLMAQLDENNFSTFYEYDDEGTLIRVKKETERGIMTLKENRQSFAK